MKAKAWYIKFPCDAYAMGPIRFEKEVGELEVKKWTREWAGVTKLVNGFQCWTTND